MNGLLSTSVEMSVCLLNCSSTGSCFLSSSLTFVCGCQPGYSGAACQINLNPCSAFPCLNNATCSADFNGTAYSNFTCSCSEWYTGFNCETQIDLCANVSCSSHGTCSIDSRQHVTTCDCYSNYLGENCETVSANLKIIQQIITASSIIAIACLCLIFILMALLDISHYICMKHDKQYKREKNSQKNN